MTKETERLVISMAKYYIENKSTIRKTAEEFNRSKTLVHIYLQKRLPLINKKLSKQYLEIAQMNYDEKAKRGGEATKLKYKYNKDNSSDQ